MDVVSGSGTADPLVVAAVVLAAGVLLLVAVRGAALVALGWWQRASAACRRAARALAPRAARRAVAALVGLAAPLAGAGASAAAPAPVEGSDLMPHRLQPDLRPRTPQPPDSTATRPPEVHVVRRGESLWSIARDHMGPRATDAQVARAWPRWWAANRRVIGPDPSLIVPGQHLRVPGRRSAGTPTQQHAAPAPATGTPVPSALSLDPDRR